MRNRRELVEAVEPRILLSADLPLEAVLPPAHEPAPTGIVETLRARADVTAEQHLPRRELVFVDAGVDGYQRLVDDLASRADPASFEVVVLERGRDGVEQMGEALAGHAGDLTAVHVVSHGDGQGLQLGDTWLSGDSLAGYADRVAGWGSAFAEGGDLLLYGCNLASSDAGRALVADLSGLTGADVAASDDLTGAAALGGDWDLEHASGAIEAALPFSAQAQAQALQTVLAAPNAVDDVSATTAGAPVVIDVTGNDADPDGDLVRVLDFTLPQNGTVVDNGDGTLTYTPDADFSGIDSFGYLATDGNRGLTHYWKLDGDAADSVGPDDGTVFGASEVAGVYGTALSFDETSDRVEIQDFSYANSFSVAFRFKIDDITGTSFQYIYSHGPEGTPDSLGIYIGETGSTSAGMLVTNIQDVDDGPGAGALDVDISGLVGDGNWHTYTLVVRSGAGSQVYIDGAFERASTRGAGGINPGQDLVLGAREDLEPTRFYGGSLDGLMVFDRALLPAQGVAYVHSGGPALAKVAITVSNAAPTAKDDAYVVDEDATLETDAWRFRRQLTFDRFAHTEDLVDFPVLVELHGGRIAYGQTQANGEDLRFYDSDGTTLLAHEIEEWNPTGTSYVWVRVPLIEGSNPTDSIWMEYGNPNAPDGQNPGGVWESGYRLVYHLGDDPGPSGTIEDSTSNSFDGQNQGSLNGTGGFSNIADTQLFDGTSQWIDMGSGIDVLNGVSAVTVSAWMAPATIAGDDQIVSFSIDGGAETEKSRLTLERVGADLVLTVRPNDDDSEVGTVATASGVLSSGTWQHVVAVVDVANDSAEIYLDGVAQPLTGSMSFTAAAFPSTASSSGALAAQDDGSDDLTGDFFAGGLDEVRVARTARSAQWIAAQQASMTDAFVSYGGAGGPALPKAVMDNDSDADGDPLKANVVSDVSNGSLSFQPDGSFLYTPDPDFAGSDSFTYQVTDGKDTSNVATVTITVNPLNDAPVLLPFGPDLTPIGDTDTGNPGDPISAILAASLTDVDGDPDLGVAITSLSSGNGSWEFKVGAGAWTAVPVVDAANALLLAGGDRIRFVPGAVGDDSASFTYYGWDGTAGGAGTTADASLTGADAAFSLASDTASIAVTHLNAAPVLTPPGADLPGISEDETANAGEAVSVILAGVVADTDVGDGIGLAITSLASGNGSWEYRIGAGPWTAAGPVDATNALLLGAADRVRFVPDGEAADSASFTYHAWDGTAGAAGAKVDASLTGSDTAFSTAVATASITVSDVNDAPVLTPVGPALTPITENDRANGGDVVSSILGASAADVDGDTPGIAVTGLVSGTGNWQYKVGAGPWRNVGSVAADDALLLGASDRLRLVPDGAHGMTGSFSYRAWDQTTGSAGSHADATANGGVTEFSSATDTATIDVAEVNDPPTLRDASLPAVLEDTADAPGSRISAIFAGKFLDRDGSFAGVAVIANTAGTLTEGRWQYSSNLGGDWFDVGTVGDDATALVLDVGTMLRFAPAPDFNGAPGGLQLRGIDDTYGGGFSSTLGVESRVFTDASQNGGTTPVSRPIADLLTWVTPVNDAPQVSGGPLGVAEGAPIGTVVGSVTGTDVDTGDVLSYAITGGNTGNAFAIDSNGQITVNDDAPLDFDLNPVFSLEITVSDDATPGLSGTGFVTVNLGNVNFPPVVGGGPFALDENSPDSAVVGTVTSSDPDSGQTLGFTILGGNTGNAFAIDASGQITVADSTALDFETNPSFDLLIEVADDGAPARSSTATVTVDLNDVNDTPSLSGGPFAIDENVPNGTPVGSVTGSDDDAGQTLSYGIVGGNTGNAFAIDSNGQITVNDSTALDFETNPSFDLIVEVRDDGLPSASSTATVTVALGDVNDAPVLAAASPALAGISEDASGNGGQTVAALVAGTIGDDDVTSVEGIAVTGLSSGNGAWQYRLGAGPWSALGSAADADALLLRAGDSIRFVPDAENADSASFSYRAWDQTSGVAGARANATVNGGSTAFSSASNSASISVTAVNDAPGLADGALAATLEDTPDPPGASLASVFSGGFSDVDSGASLAGVAVIGNAAPAGQGVWQYSSDGGATWYAVGAVADGPGALALGSGSLVRFVPASGFSGDATSLVVRALDDSYGGGFSTTAGVESRAFVDTGVPGGTSPIGASPAALSTSVAPFSGLPDPDPDLDPGPAPDPDADPGAPPPPEDPPPSETTDPDLPADDPADDPGGSLIVEAGTGGGPFVLERASERLILGADGADADALLRETVARGERGDFVRMERDADSLFSGLFGVKLPSGMTLAEFLSQTDFRGELDRVQEQLGRIARLESQAVTSAMGLTASLSVGYVLWLTRGGLLLASLVSSMPAWRLIDPIPVLSRRSDAGEDGRDEGESLGSLLSRASNGNEDRNEDASESAEADAGSRPGVDGPPQD